MSNRPSRGWRPSWSRDSSIPRRSGRIRKSVTESPRAVLETIKYRPRYDCGPLNFRPRCGWMEGPGPGAGDWGGKAMLAMRPRPAHRIGALGVLSFLLASVLSGFLAPSVRGDAPIVSENSNASRTVTWTMGTAAGLTLTGVDLEQAGATLPWVPANVSWDTPAKFLARGSIGPNLVANATDISLRADTANHVLDGDFASAAPWTYESSPLGNVTAGWDGGTGTAVFRHVSSATETSWDTMDDRVGGDLRGLEHRLRHPGHRRPQGDPLCGIEAAPDAAGRDERQAHVGEPDRRRCRDAPIPERGPQAFLQARRLLPRPVVFHRGERGAPEAADVDRLDAGLLESGRRLPRDPRAGLLRHDGELRREGPDGREATLSPAVSFRLHDLLQEIEMDDQGVRVDHVDRAFRVRDAVGPLALLRHQLRRAEVREDERDAVILHDRVRRGELRLLQRGALRSDAHRDPDLGRGLGR